MKMLVTKSIYIEVKHGNIFTMIIINCINYNIYNNSDLNCLFIKKEDSIILITKVMFVVLQNINGII